MFEDKRYTNANKNRFFIPEDNNTGLHNSNDNLNFNEEKSFQPRLPKETKEIKEKKPKKFKGLAIFLILIIILFVLLITLFGLIHFLSSPAKIYIATFDNIYNLANEYLKASDNNKLSYDKKEDILTNMGTFNFYTDYPVIDSFSSFNYEYKMVLDNKNEQFDGNLVLKNGNDSLLDIKAYLRENKIYLQDYHIYSEIINLGDFKVNFDNFKKSYEYKDMINLLNCFKTTLASYIVNDNLSKEKETIKVNNKSVKVTSNIFKLSEEQTKEFVKVFLENLIDDEDALKCIINLSGNSRKETISMLKEIKSNGSLMNNLKTIEMRIFTEGLANNFIGFKISYDKKDIIKYFKEENGYNFDVIKDNIRLTFENKENINDIKLYFDEDDILKAKVSKEEDTIKTEFVMRYEDENNNFYELDGTISSVVKRIGDKRQTHKLSVNVDTVLNDKDYNFKLELNNTTQVGGKVANASINNARVIEELNNNELKVIDKNIRAAFNKTPLYNLYESTLAKNIESKLYCDKAYDCSCNENGCTCKYIGQYNVEKEVICKI